MLYRGVPMLDVNMLFRIDIPRVLDIMGAYCCVILWRYLIGASYGISRRVSNA